MNKQYFRRMAIGLSGITAAVALRFIWKWVKRLVLYFVIASLLGVLVFRFVPVPFTWLMLSRSAAAVAEGESPRWKKDWVPLEAISGHLQLAAVCSEDQRFLQHNGFDFEAIQAAIEYNKTHEDKRGASTISQQTAKNTFLWEGRSWLRKGLEVWFTALIELCWNKQRIMEVYLNIIEFGRGVYGAEAAAQHYFGVSAKKLSASQSARLMSIVPSPLNWKMDGRISGRRTRHILRQMQNHGKMLEYDSAKP